jgi:adenine-specific DNA-methyltransferase
LPTIASITRERVRAAGRSVRSRPALLGSDPHDAPDLGFRAFRLSPSNFTVWNAEAAPPQIVAQQLTMAVEQITVGAADEAMLTELLLKAGYPLTAEVEDADFSGTQGHSIAKGALLVCLSKRLTIEAFEAMAERDPAMILVLDAGFSGSDELKVNALQTVRARNQRVGSDIALRVV